MPQLICDFSQGPERVHLLLSYQRYFEKNTVQNACLCLIYEKYLVHYDDAETSFHLRTCKHFDYDTHSWYLLDQHLGHFAH